MTVTTYDSEYNNRLHVTITADPSIDGGYSDVHIVPDNFDTSSIVLYPNAIYVGNDTPTGTLSLEVRVTKPDSSQFSDWIEWSEGAVSSAAGFEFNMSLTQIRIKVVENIGVANISYFRRQ